MKRIRTALGTFICKWCPCMLILAGLTACGQNEIEIPSGIEPIATVSPLPEESNVGGSDVRDAGAGGNTAKSESPEAVDDTGKSESADSGDAAEVLNSAREREYREKFGDNCIAEQTFEASLSAYEGKVYFVPFAPGEGQQDFGMKIIQDGKVLKEIFGYVPKGLEGKGFVSLDAVSFFDVNYDGITDIVLIETYGDTSFAAVYYGNEDGSYFLEEILSENLTKQVEDLSIFEIRDYLSEGRKNGAFHSYQEAYEAVGRLCAMETVENVEFDLIYFNEDETPELVAGVLGYYTSMFTYHDGKVYTLMDRWAYGAGGNAGYEYCPGKNSLRNYDSDYAGAILYTSYMSISDQFTMDLVVQIKTCNFDDLNQNGFPDEEEQDSLGKYSVSYINGEVATTEECAACEQGEYKPIVGTMDFETLKVKL